MTHGPVFFPVTTEHLTDIAVCACSVGSNFHAAVMFLDASNQPRVLDLRLDGSVNSTAVTNRFAFSWAIPRLEPSVRDSVRELCIQLSDSPPALFYGLKYAQSEFYTSGSSVVTKLSGDTIGLTCATFVLMLFDTIGLPLVDHATWPVRTEDEQHMRNLADWAREELINTRGAFGLADDIFDKNSQAIPCVRFRPEEVLAAATVTVLPATFDDCSALGAEIVGWIRNADARRKKKEPA